MKSLKLWVVAVVMVLILLLTVACGEDAPSFLELSSVTTLTPTASTEKVNRYNALYTDTFTPSAEYGELVPFIGDVLTYKNTAEGIDDSVVKPIYGLCTSSGAIVVDPVYDGVVTHRLDGICLYEILIGSDKPQLAEERLLIPSNGTWMIELSSAQRVSNISGSGRFAIERDRVVKRNRKNVTLTYYDFYTFDGVRSFTFDKKLTEAENTSFNLGFFSDDLMNVNVTVTTETVEKDKEGKDVTVKTKENYGYYVDLSGKTVFKKLKFLKTEEFADGLAVVASEDGKYGILKSDGKYLFEPQFNIINRNVSEGYFACGTDSYFLIINTNGEEIAKVFCENADIEVLGTENIIYKKTLKYSGKTEFFSVATGGAFTCKETGQFPDADTGRFGIFTCSYSGVTDIFDKDGNSFAQFADFGRLCGVWGDYAVVTGKNGGVWIVNIKNGEKTDRLDGSFTGIVHSDGKYTVVSNQGKYSVYGFSEKTFVVENADFVFYHNGVLSVSADGYITVYGANMQILMRYCCEAEVPK